MKRIIILMLTCAMVFGAALSSSATEFKASGTFDLAFDWADNPDPRPFNGVATDNQDKFQVIQRLRTQIDIIASESLRAVYYLEIGDMTWGQNGGSSLPKDLNKGSYNKLAGQGAGGAIGTDGVNIETKRLFLDYRMPHTALSVRMGLQGIALPSLANNNPVLDDDVAGVLVNYAFTDQFNVVAAWARAADTDGTSVTLTGGTPFEIGTSKNKYDVFTIIAGLDFEDITVVPYITYAPIGRWANIDAMYFNTNGELVNYATDDTDVWWLGLSAKSNSLPNLNLAFDFVWGWADSASLATTTNAAKIPAGRDQSGFYVLLHGDYKMEMFTPTLDLWYSSGDDNSGDGNLMPIISAGGLELTNLGTDGGFFDTTDNAFTTSGIGTFGVVLGLTEVSFIENVTHDFKVAYMQGTSDYSNNAARSNTFPTDEDRAWEFNIDTNWQMYENLAAIVELGYLNPDYDNAEGEEAVWKAAIGFQYTY
ncbi:MAG: outer membrane homotrimeric porin [Desulfovibrionales bacterium]|nr:outer membrane homotrimeric porin [Desulfovibrionales bacterium]